MENKIMRKAVAYSMSDEIDTARTIIVDGSCLDSDCSPLRLKDGQRIKVHKYEGFSLYRDIEKVRHKVCVIQFNYEGQRYFYAKEIVGIDEMMGALRLRFYYPEQKDLYLNMRNFEGLFLIDDVID